MPRNWKTNKRTKKPFMQPGETNPDVGKLGHMRYACGQCGAGMVQGVEHRGPSGQLLCSHCYEDARAFGARVAKEGWSPGMDFPVLINDVWVSREESEDGDLYYRFEGPNGNWFSLRVEEFDEDEGPEIDNLTKNFASEWEARVGQNLEDETSGEEPKPWAMSSKEKDELYQRTCRYCGKVFPTYEDAEKHEQWHTGAGPDVAKLLKRREYKPTGAKEPRQFYSHTRTDKELREIRKKESER